MRKMLVDFITRNDNVFLFSLVYLIYNINCRRIGSGDTVPASLLPFSLLEYHNLYLDKFYCYFTSEFNPVWFCRDINGHYLSIYPIVIPSLITIFYIVPYIYLKSNNIPLDMFQPGFAMAVSLMEKLSASLIASISVIFVYLSLKELTNKKTATIVALIYAFATNTWATSSQALWQQGLVELFLSTSIFLVLKNERESSNKLIVFLGILSGLFVFNRQIDSILLIPVICYIISIKVKKIFYYAIFVFLSGFPFLIYNLYFFGSLFGGYSAFFDEFDLSPDMIYRLLGLLISPSRGLFIYSPIILISILGYLKVPRISNKRIKKFLLIMGPSCLVLLFAYSTWISWWGGGCYGPRLLTGMLPSLAILSGLFVKDINLNTKCKKNLFIIGVISLLLIWSVFVQFVGAFYYPNGGWDADSNKTEKQWDWRDTQIERTFSAGMGSPEYCLKNLNDIMTLAHQKDASPYEIFPAKGWFGLELWDGVPSRWMPSDSMLIIYSPDNRAANLSLRALSFYRPRSLQIYAKDELAADVAIPTSFINVTAPIHLANGTNTVRLHVPEGCERPCDINEMNNSDSRCLSIAVQNVTAA